MREHWRELGYWRWLWRSAVPREAKMAAVVLLVALLIAGGWFAANRLTAAQAQVASTGDLVLETTVQKVVTVREHGKLIRKTVPVVKKVVLPARTATAYEVTTSYRTQVVRTPGQVKVVRHVVKTLVPVVKKQVVTVNGKARTVVQTRYVPTTRVQTQTQTLTNVVTNRQVVTSSQTQVLTAPPTTIRTTSTTTTTKTTTLPVTTTQVVTTTQTQTETATVTETTTDTVTTTTTTVPEPVTVTVTTTASP